ncbi:DUF427 domain-containing protein [Pleomorphovibrio marinus]|uniref:DUF427 domain-containing protein n=1 Tax=Pleomorphovibrio marinus TaxID=2164132 RepID=UPI000E0B9A42|nr:DUF427 domain-containing protein [Pleomorphovibrio marinus]
MKAIWKNTLLAETDDTVIVENNHYFPHESLNKEFFEVSEHSSACPWKGTANYYHIRVGEDINPNAAWFYNDPKEAAKHIKGRVAFWKGVKVE